MALASQSCREIGCSHSSSHLSISGVVTPAGVAKGTLVALPAAVVQRPSGVRDAAQREKRRQAAVSPAVQDRRLRRDERPSGIRVRCGPNSLSVSAASKRRFSRNVSAGRWVITGQRVELQEKGLDQVGLQQAPALSKAPRNIAKRKPQMAQICPTFSQSF